LKPDDAATKGRPVPVAFYIYPVMQAATILLPRAHLGRRRTVCRTYVELIQQVARRFNREFRPIFPEPEALVGRVPRLLGTDGNAKMSKSRGNTIDLKDGADVAKKVRASCAGQRHERAGEGRGEAGLRLPDAFDHDAAEVSDLRSATAVTAARAYEGTARAV